MVSRIRKKLRWLLNEAAAKVFRPSIRIDARDGLVRLGSAYGGWTILDTVDLPGSVVISCGLGEDASFDVEVAARYGAKIVIVDPTPRAVRHFEQLESRIGRPAETGYVAGGVQPVAAYDLASVSPDQPSIEPRALWIDDRPVRFYKPSDPTHVSHSITFAASGREDDFITVPTVTMNALLDMLPPGTFSILKMDIEGAEVGLLDTIDAWSALPTQILVEFDVLRRPGTTSRTRVERTDALLRTKGYRCAHVEGRNYLYVLDA